MNQGPIWGRFMKKKKQSPQISCYCTFNIPCCTIQQGCCSLQLCMYVHNAFLIRPCDSPYLISCGRLINSLYHGVLHSSGQDYQQKRKVLEQKPSLPVIQFCYSSIQTGPVERFREWAERRHLLLYRACVQIFILFYDCTVAYGVPAPEVQRMRIGEIANLFIVTNLRSSGKPWPRRIFSTGIITTGTHYSGTHHPSLMRVILSVTFPLFLPLKYTTGLLCLPGLDPYWFVGGTVGGGNSDFAG